MDGDNLKQATQDSAVSSRPQHIQSFQRMVAPNSAVATESAVANYQIPTVHTSSDVQKIILACNKQSSSQAPHELVKPHVIQLPLAKRLAGVNDVPTFVAMSVTSDKLLATNGATSLTSAKHLTTDGATSVTFAKLLATNGATSVTSAKILASHQMPTKNNLSEKQQLAIAYLQPPVRQASCVSVIPQIIHLPNRLLVPGRMISVTSAEPKANYLTPTGNDLSKKQRIRLAYLPVTPNVLHFSQRMPAPNRTVSISVTSAEPATSHQILTVNDQPENQSIKQVYRKQTPCYNSFVPKTPQAIQFSKRTFAPNSTVSVSASSAEPIASYQIPAMNNLSDKQVMALAYRQQPSSQDSVVSETPKHVHYSRNVTVPTSTVSVRVSHSVYKPVNQEPATNLSSHTTQQQFMAIDSFTKPSKEGVDRPVDHTTNKDKTASVMDTLRPSTEDTQYKLFDIKSMVSQSKPDSHASEKKTTFHCGVCKKVFRTRSHLYTHMMNHCDIKQYVCKVCCKRFKILSNLKRHSLIHGKQSKFKSGHESFPNFSDLNHHINEQKKISLSPFSCDICHKEFADMDLLLDHMDIHFKDKIYSCDMCLKTFRDKYNLKSHIRVHNGEKPYKCDTCNKSFSRHGNLKSHVFTHIGNRPFTCDTCNRSFLSFGALMANVRSHCGIKLYSCDECPLQFAKAWAFRRHRHLHSYPFICGLCKASFDSSEKLSSHMNLHSQGSSSYMCPERNNMFGFPVAL